MKHRIELKPGDSITVVLSSGKVIYYYRNQVDALSIKDLLVGQWFVLRNKTDAWMRTRVRSRQGKILCVSPYGEMKHIDGATKVAKVIGIVNINPELEQ